MEVKPGYKRTEVGLIPVEWDDVKIGEVTKIFIGRDLIADRFSRNDYCLCSELSGIISLSN